MKLAVFDVDSTLLDAETIETIGREMGIEKEIAGITERTMKGDLDFFDSLTYRVSLLKGLPIERVNQICKTLPLMPGAKELIQELKSRGIKVICLSGGFKNATIPLSKKLGLDADFSNTLHSKEGFLTGQVGGEMMFSHSKADILSRLQKLLGISIQETLVVGDGSNDLSMFPYAAYKVAFCAKPILKEKANIILDKKDLSLLIPVLFKKP